VEDFMSQAEAILKDLQAGARLTQLEAYQRYRCTRLAARVDDLKRAGYPVHAEMVERNGKHVAEYSMIGELFV
jgi:hypothetical protein